MRLLIIDQCSSSKAVADGAMVFNEGDIDEHGREALLSRKQVPKLAAKDLYTGRQQRLTSQAVDRLRAAGDDVDRVFVSAGFGVVDEDDLLPPYEATFSGRSEAKVLERSSELGIQSSLEELFAEAEAYDVVFFALGHNYYLGIELTELLSRLDPSTYVVLFNKQIEGMNSDRVISISARNEEAKENGATVIALKGQFIKNFAEHREMGAEIQEPEDIVTYCTTEVTSQLDLEEFDA